MNSAERLRRGASLSTRLLATVVLLSLVPIGVLSILSLRHVDRIREVSAHETQVALAAAQVSRLQERLSVEAGRLSALFFRVRGEIHALRSMAEAVLADPPRFTYRNGSRYTIDPQGEYANHADDGNSALSIRRYSPRLAPLAAATESLDLVMRPLAEREPRMALAWFLSAEGLTRAFPWRDFRQMPHDKDYVEWPFYYLADPGHNPTRDEVFTDIYLDPLSGDWMISCLAPVYVGGRHAGTVGLDITIQSLLKEIRAIRFSEHSVSLLASGSTVIAASEGMERIPLGLDRSRGLQGQDLNHSPLPTVRALARLLYNREPVVETLELSGRRMYAGCAPVNPPGWRVALLVPEEDVIGEARRTAENVLVEARQIRTNFLHILVFSLISVLGVTWFVFFYQSRGLRILLARIRTLGQGDLSARIEEGPGEFGRLARALNSMAEGLQEKTKELQRAQAEVEQGRKLAAVGQLAAGVAHEVNNPLATISTHAQMLMRRSDVPPDASSDLEIVMEEIRRIQGKLRNLLDLSRVQSPVRKALDPCRLVEEVAGLARHEAEARGIDLQLQIDPDVPLFRLDRSGIKQVLWNLLGNALDAQGSGGVVIVRSRTEARDGEGKVLVLEVEDRGPGVPEEIMPRIFEPFFTTKEVGQGTGLGLAVAYSVVRSHEGRIGVENLPGGGCVFRVFLPEGESA